jgi:hypothetical protein
VEQDLEDPDEEERREDQPGDVRQLAGDRTRERRLQDVVVDQQQPDREQRDRMDQPIAGPSRSRISRPRFSRCRGAPR